MTTSPQTGDDQRRVEAVRKAFPAEGLFAEKEWLLSPRSFSLSPQFVGELEKLGYRLHLFQRACNLLYRLSVKGKQPTWVADYLDRGKPPELVALSRERIFRDEIARVIRPDIIPTENGFTIAELDSVPGGIGLTAWFNQTYAALGDDVVGGAYGMLDGFASIFPGGDIAVSAEAGTYKPEMEWLAAQLNGRAGLHPTWNDDKRRWKVVGTEQQPLHDDADAARAAGEALNVYRFFEHFDLPNLPVAPWLMERAREGSVHVTPPFKPYMEEKMWFALFWTRPLQAFWRRELGERHWLKLQKVIPYTWILDPAPLPHQAVIAGLEINDWRELAGFSQKQRELILKISGYSELAWGSRGVDLAQDLPHAEWRQAIDRALTRFPSNPMLLQRFHKGRLVEQPYLHPANRRDRHHARAGAALPVLFPRGRESAVERRACDRLSGGQEVAAWDERRRHRPGAHRERWNRLTSQSGPIRPTGNCCRPCSQGAVSIGTKWGCGGRTRRNFTRRLQVARRS